MDHLEESRKPDVRVRVLYYICLRVKGSAGKIKDKEALKMFHELQKRREDKSFPASATAWLGEER